MSIRAKDLTPAERLRVDRLRRGENQVEAAARCNVPLAMYKRWEAGGPAMYCPTLRRLHPHEQCMVLRMRAGRTQAEVAEAVNLCRYRVHQIERGKVPVPAVMLRHWGIHD